MPNTKKFKKYHTFCISSDYELIRKLQTIAFFKQISVSDIINELIIKYVEKNEQKEAVL